MPCTDIGAVICNRTRQWNLFVLDRFLTLVFIIWTALFLHDIILWDIGLRILLLELQFPLDVLKFSEFSSDILCVVCLILQVLCLREVLV